MSKVISSITGADFWRGRLKRFGHTGWASIKIYAFDQYCRLKKFSEILDELAISPGLALDFGCGTGDFSKLLLSRGWRVVAYDPFVTPDLRSDQFQFFSDLTPALSGNTFDLVISITALDHCVQDDEFNARLTDISNSLKIDGQFIFLEYAVDELKDKTAYQAFRHMNEWEVALSHNHLNLQEVTPFFHPDLAPIATWSKYESNIIVRCLVLMNRLHLPCKTIWNYVLNYCFSVSQLKNPSKSPIKLMVGRKTKNCLI